MKNKIKYILQKILGFKWYLRVFALFKISIFAMDKRERDFLFFVKIIPSEGIIIDAGANIGVMSYFLSTRHSKSTIYAIEPLEENYQSINLIKLIFRLSNCILIPKALSDTPKSLTIVMPNSGAVREQGLSHVIEKDSDVSGVKFDIEADSIDNLFKDQDKSVVGIKIDVENHEWFVIKGAEYILTHHSPIVYCELWDNEWREKCIQLMKEYDYLPYVLLNDKLCLFDSREHNTLNFFFLPLSRKSDWEKHTR